MGGCFSARTERKSPSYNGLDSNVDGRQDDISRSGLSRTSKTLKCFKLKELKTATRNLISDSQVSEEELYVKGWIDENTLGPTKPGSGFTIAVKKLNHVSHQEPSEWLRKINNMGQLSHPNLVRLIGYCLEDIHPILVYEFVTKGSLDNNLFRSLYSKIDWIEDDTLIGLISNATSSRDLKCFTLKELKTATRNLIPDSQVSEEELYVKGWIDEHTLGPTKPGYGLSVAVKKLNNASHQEPSEWLRKINNMGQLSHPNLVRLIGYCLEDDYRILVYEFVTKGSLDKCLFERDSDFQPLSWKMRMKIALDAAKGLEFLHSDEVNVIHGDFRSSNILIDSNHNAKLSDFGLDKDVDAENRARVKGTITQYSYASPEYFMSGLHTKMSDVYSLGVVLLEIMSGKRTFDINRPPCEQSFVK